MLNESVTFLDFVPLSSDNVQINLGKVQKLKDKKFGVINNFYAHTTNPSATVKTNIATYKTYTLQRAYSGLR